MLFDLKKFYAQGDEPRHEEFSPDFSGGDFPGYTVADAVCGFTAVPTRAGIDLELSVKAEVLAECARCLAPVSQTFSFEREWSVREADLSGGDFDLPVNERGCLDLEELVYQELVLEVPPVLLCSPECSGLCPICGKRKAAGCSCQQAESAAPVDARLSILKQLLN